MPGTLNRGFEVLARSWCKLMHTKTTWPFRGYYRCPQCHRAYHVPWDEPGGRTLGAKRTTVPRAELAPLKS